MLCNFISLLPLPLAPGGVSSVPSPTAGPRLASPSSQAGRRAPPVINPLPPLPCLWEHLRMVLHPTHPRLSSGPRLKPSRVDRPSQMGEKRVWVSNWTPGRKWGAREGGSEGQEHRPGAQEDQEPLGENPFKMSHMCKRRGLRDHPDPLASLPSLLPTFRGSAQCLGSWWAPCHWTSSRHIWPGRSQMTGAGAPPSRYLRGLIHTFL